MIEIDLTPDEFYLILAALKHFGLVSENKQKTETLVLRLKREQAKLG